jgi:hypothetical protein
VPSVDPQGARALAAHDGAQGAGVTYERDIAVVISAPDRYAKLRQLSQQMR